MIDILGFYGGTVLGSLIGIVLAVGFRQLHEGRTVERTELEDVARALACFVRDQPLPWKYFLSVEDARRHAYDIAYTLHSFNVADVLRAIDELPEREAIGPSLFEYNPPGS